MSEHRLTGPLALGENADSSAVGTFRNWRLRHSFETLAAIRGALVVLVLTGLVGTWHLDRYPRTWFDEGAYLDVAHSIAERGAYVAEAPDGTRDFAPVIAVGPTVLVPAAAVQATLNSTLATSRLIGSAYLVAASLAFYLLTRRLFGERAALLSILVLMAMPALDWIGTGRQLLGEVPAVLFLIVGAALAFRGNCMKHAGAAGLMLGLAMVTKGQYLLVLPAALFLITLLDYFSSRVRSLRWYAVLIVVAIGVYVGWLVALLSLIGEGDIVENYRLLRDSSGGALLVFDLDRMSAAWTLLLGPSALFLVLPAAVYGFILFYRENDADRRMMLGSLWIFQVCWLTWFAMASIAWPRYAFPGLVLSAVFAGVMLSDLVGALHGRRLTRTGRSTWLTTAGLGCLAVIGLLLAVGLIRQTSPVFAADHREPQRFAAALDDVVPPGTIVDGWEPEIDFLSAREMQYPPIGSLDRVVRATWLGAAQDVDVSDSLSADYLVIGHFGRWVGAYEAALESGQYQLVLSDGGFELYQRNAAR